MSSDMLNEIEEAMRNESPDRVTRRSDDFMIAYLSELRNPLPEAAQQGLNVARAFRSGAVDAKELERARVACWKYLAERSASTDITTPIHCGVRAVICLLWDKPQPGVGIVDLLDFFLIVADRFEDHSDIAEALLRRFFLSETS